MIQEERKWYYVDVMEMCVAEKLYTRGTDQEYTSMINFISHAKPTIENMMCVASNILNHSDTERTLEDIMYLLNKRCVFTFYKITDQEDFISEDYKRFMAMEKMLDSMKE